jgi:hypothetical protein
VCSWRDGGSVRASQQEFDMGRGDVVSGERGVVGEIGWMEEVKGEAVESWCGMGGRGSVVCVCVCV